MVDKVHFVIYYNFNYKNFFYCCYYSYTSLSFWSQLKMNLLKNIFWLSINSFCIIIIPNSILNAVFRAIIVFLYLSLQLYYTNNIKILWYNPDFHQYISPMFLIQGFQTYYILVILTLKIVFLSFWTIKQIKCLFLFYLV